MNHAHLFCKKADKNKRRKSQRYYMYVQLYQSEKCKDNLFSGLLVLLTPILQQQNFKDLQQQS